MRDAVSPRGVVGSGARVLGPGFGPWVRSWATAFNMTVLHRVEHHSRKSYKISWARFQRKGYGRTSTHQKRVPTQVRAVNPYMNHSQVPWSELSYEDPGRLILKYVQHRTLQPSLAVAGRASGSGTGIGVERGSSRQIGDGAGIDLEWICNGYGINRICHITLLGSAGAADIAFAGSILNRVFFDFKRTFLYIMA